MSLLRRFIRWCKDKAVGRVRARSIVLEDGLGRERAGLAIDKSDNSLLYFQDQEGNVRLYMGLTEEGTPRVDMRYASGNGSIQLEANDSLNTAGIVLTGPEGKVQLVIGVASDGTPAIALTDESGERLMPIPISPEAAGREDDDQDGDPNFDWDSILRQL